MDAQKKFNLIVIFMASYLAIFAYIIILQSNIEFLYYTVVVAVLLAILVFKYRHIYYLNHLWMLMALVGFLHFIGGVVHINGTTLYSSYFLAGGFRYDHFMHVIGSAVFTLLFFSLLAPHLDAKVRKNKVHFSFLLILITMGLGTLNEISEFIAVQFFEGTEGVGGYVNNSVDLIYNFVGSLITCYFLFSHKFGSKLRRRLLAYRKLLANKR